MHSAYQPPGELLSLVFLNTFGSSARCEHRGAKLLPLPQGEGTHSSPLSPTPQPPIQELRAASHPSGQSTCMRACVWEVSPSTRGGWMQCVPVSLLRASSLLFLAFFPFCFMCFRNSKPCRSKADVCSEELQLTHPKSEKQGSDRR